MSSKKHLMLTIGGAALTLFALTADLIGIGSPGFKREQVVMLAAGLFALLWGLLKHRFADFYRVVALNLLNLVIILFCLEVASTFLLRIQQAWPSATEDLSSRDPQKLPWPAHGGFPVPSLVNFSYYSTQDWANQYWDDLNLALRTKHYRPWVQWDYGPLERETINIGEDGIRVTPETNCEAGAYKVFTYGGSTMWGLGAPDWGTIAAYLQTDLQNLSDRPVCVVNYGEIAYSSTQNVVQLLLDLQSGNVPDLVIFYDGIADIIDAFEDGVPGEHLEMDVATARFNIECPTINRPRLLNQSSLFLLLKSWVPERRLEKRNYRTEVGDAQVVGASTAEIYLANYDIMGALAKEYGFDFLFFWQPIISYGDKPLTEEEQLIGTQLSTEFVELTDAVYSEILRLVDTRENLYFIANVFDGVEGEIWTDMFHVNPVGNRLLADSMFEEVNQNPRLLARIGGQSIDPNEG